jgi:hypothetical protein
MDTLSQKPRYVSPAFLGLLKSVGPIATAIAPVTPEIGSLVWGSVSLLAEVSQLAWNVLCDFN